MVSHRQNRVGAVLAISGCALILPFSQCHAACQALRTFADGRKPSTEIFVSPSGDNTTGNGSVSRPFRTLARAVQNVREGTAIRLLGGTYAAGTFLQNLSGSSNAPVWIGGTPGQPRPLIDGGSEALHLTRVRFLVVENLEIARSSSNGINCDDGGDYANAQATHHVIFRNLRFRDIGSGGNQDGLKLSGVNAFHVLECSFERMSAGGSAIDQVGCHAGVIAGCSFTDSGSNSIQCKGGTEDIEVRGNRFLNGGARAINIGGSTGFEFFRPPLSRSQPNVEARDIRVLANLFQGSEAPVAFVGTVESLVANNTFVEPTKWVMRILQETVSSGGYTFLPSGNNRFQNNVVYFDRNRVTTFANVGPNTAAGTFSFANNLWYAFNQPSRSQPTLPSSETAGVYGRDPLFRNPMTGDFSVPTNSPVAAKGRVEPTPGVDLAQRCFGQPPSIGAYEARPTSSPVADADGDQVPDDWEAAHGFDPFNSADADQDTDGDRASNQQEWVAGTDPRDSGSVLRLTVVRTATGGISLRFPTARGRTYRVQDLIPPSQALWTEQFTQVGFDGTADVTLANPGESLRYFRVVVAVAE